MNNVTLIQNGRPTDFTGPKNWEELTQEQYKQYCRSIDQHGTALEGRIALLTVWYAIPFRLLQKLSSEQRLDLLALLDFLDDRPDRWMLPELKLGKLGLSTYVGPGDGLDLLTFLEFILAEAALQKYMATDPPELEHAARLTAALYRSYSKVGNGKRSPFALGDVDSETARAKELPAFILKGVVLNYMGCRDQFPTLYPHLFRQTGKKADTESNWLDVGLSLVRQTSALGTFAQLEQTNLFLALTTLDQIMKEQQELEERLKKDK